MAVHLAQIKAFLNRPGIEGPQQLRGYIPCHRKSGGTANFRGPESGHPDDFTAMGISGVTIATGVDLGQTDEAWLTRYGLDVKHIAIVRPYLGLRQGAAIQKLFSFPLAVSRETADALDMTILSIHAERIPARYNRDNPATAFEDLPWQSQTAIFSLLFQRGTGVAGKAPNTWAAFVRGDWKDAANRLRNPALWDGYHLRRRMEGELLMEIV